MKSWLIITALLLLAAHAGAQTPLSPPALKWGNNGIQPPGPTQSIGYDSGTGLPCIVGSTATCKLAVSAGSATLPPNAAQETGGNLAAILTKITSDPATQTTLAAVLAKLSADPATQTTLAAVLAKITSDPSTATNQATALADLGAPGDAAWSGSGSGAIGPILKAIWTKLNATVAVTGTFWQATQPVSAASLPLPAGAMQQTGGTVGLVAGVANIGNVGGKTVAVCVTPTVTASNAYGTNYVVGGKLTFANAFTATGTGILQSVAVTIKKVETSGFHFVPFNADPSNTTWTDAAVAAINAADVAAVREPVSLAAYSGLGTHTIASAVGIGQALAPGTTSLYGVLIADAALSNNFGSISDVQVCVKVLDDL